MRGEHGAFGGVLRGKVVTNREPSSIRRGSFVGAEVLSNNTAEMQAVIETLLFLLAQVELDNPHVPVGDSVVIHSDSKYVTELITHGSRSNAN